MSTFHLNILAADRPFFKGECESLTLPTSYGEYGILAHHRNTIAAVVPGMLRYRTPDGEKHIASVSDGIVKIEHGEVLVLVDTIERPEEIDAVKAQRLLDEAKEALLQKQSIADYHATCARIARSLARLKVKDYREL